MNRFLHSARLFTLILLGLVFLPVAAFAAETKTETVTIEVNTTTPGGVPIIGTVVVHRTGDAAVQSAVSFNGMVNGAPTSAQATATENWSSDGQAQITINEITGWNSTVPQPANLTINLSQTSAGVVSVNGIPVAIDGLLQMPFTGRTSYSVTSAGGGSHQIDTLPRTGAGPLAINPLLIVGLLIASGLVLMALGTLVQQQGRRAARAKR